MNFHTFLPGLILATATVLTSSLQAVAQITFETPPVTQSKDRASYYQALCRAEGGVSVTRTEIVSGGYAYYVSCRKNGVTRLLAVTRKP
jgi:hypothetical protein